MRANISVAHEKLPHYNPASLLHVIEARFILRRLETALLSNIHYHDIELKRLLKDRWRMIKNSNMQYLHDFTNPANEACIAIAKILAGFAAVSYLEILMPDLSRTRPEEYLTSSYTEEDIDLKALILSDRSSHIIHVGDVLESSQDDGVLKCNYLVGKKVCKLSSSERERLLSRHLSVRAAFDALQARIKFKLDGDTVGSAVRRLIHGLLEGGVAKNGSEHNAGADANVAIFEFNQYRDTLAPETLVILDSAGKFDRFLTQEPEWLVFAQLWTYLKEPTFEEKGTQTVRYCVQMVARKMEELLEENPALYELCSYQEGGLKQLSDLNFAVGDAMRKMNVSLRLLEHHYCYSDTPSELLCAALSQNSRNFRLNADETAYFFNKYIESRATTLNLSKLNDLVSSICKTHRRDVVELALSYLDRDSQAIIQRDFKLLPPPVSQMSLFNERKRGTSNVDANDGPVEKKARSRSYVSM